MSVAQVLPLSWGRGFGVGLARIASKVRPQQYQLARGNLARALPELSATEREKILKASVPQLGRNLFHTLVAPRLLAASGLVQEVPCAEANDRLIADRLEELGAEGRGVFILGGHIGCWELAGGWLAQLVAQQNRGPLAAVTGTIHNPPIDRMVQRWRRKMGMLPLAREGGVAPILKVLKAGGTVAILLDQRTRVRNIEVPFFGELAPTPVALAQLALQFGIPVLPVAGMWDNERKIHLMRHLPPIRPTDFESDDQVGFLTACNQALESFIRGNPEQWVWFHRRWNEVANNDKEVL